MDKLAAYDELKFNAVFHGDDWKNSKMYDELEKAFNELGVDMVFLPHTDGISSTILAEKSYENR